MDTHQHSLKSKPTLILGIGPARTGTSYLFSLFLNDNFNVTHMKEDMYLYNNSVINIYEYKKCFRTTDKNIYVDVNPRYSFMPNLDEVIAQLNYHFDVRLICTVRDPVNSVISGIEAAGMSYGIYQEHYDFKFLIERMKHHPLYVKFLEHHDFESLSKFVGADIETHTRVVNVNQRVSNVKCTESIETIRKKMNKQYEYFFRKNGEVFIKTIWEHA